ncbi:MAG TPA: aminoacyl-tRNA hydrolase [Casimicrobiaceae bacterium]|nr:aminoacyl-tRNA hydrolase [Casimicrobiaceae bacterium]
MEPIRLVVGLGNPGREHVATRHNAGYWFADALAARLGLAFRGEAKFHGQLAKANDGLRLLKPSTYMNLSGRSVSSCARFFTLAPRDVLVVHDELDLPPGEAKLKFGGGIAGHNGLRDVAAQLGTPDFWRLRLGIGHPRDSAIPQQDVGDYVLAPPSRDDRAAIEEAIGRSLEAWPAIATGDFERAMMSLHTRKEKT